VIEQQIRFKRDDGTDGEHELMLGRIVAVGAHERVLVNGELQWDLVDTIYRSRPRTWRTLGPVLGYDARKDPLLKPREASELINQRAAGYGGLADLIRQTPYPTQVASTGRQGNSKSSEASTPVDAPRADPSETGG
jgi:hypothetical protein